MQTVRESKMVSNAEVNILLVEEEVLFIEVDIGISFEVQVPRIQVLRMKSMVAVPGIPTVTCHTCYMAQVLALLRVRVRAAKQQ